MGVGEEDQQAEGGVEGEEGEDSNAVEGVGVLQGEEVEAVLLEEAVVVDLVDLVVVEVADSVVEGVVAAVVDSEVHNGSMLDLRCPMYTYFPDPSLIKKVKAEIW